MSATAGHNALMEEAAQDRAASPSPIDDAAFVEELNEAAVAYLLLSWPLISIARGEKRARLSAAWHRLAQAHARRWLRDLRTPLPHGSRGVALSLHRAVLDLCRAYGVTGVDLTETYNAIVDEGVPAKGDGVGRIKALLALLIGEEIVTR